MHLQNFNKNTINNSSISHTSGHGVHILSTAADNVFNNMAVYKNKDNGFHIDGSNNIFNDVYTYANGGAGIGGAAPGNYYHGTLTVFGNGTSNTVGSLARGLASTWLGVFRDGNLVTTGTYGPAWAVRPSNVSGFDINHTGYQEGLTWPHPLTWTFGASIPRQKAPILPSNCTFAATTVNKCLPATGDVSTYNSTKFIGQW